MPDGAEFFAQFFGGGGATFFDFSGGEPRRRKGQDTELSYDVTLEDLYSGKVVKMNMEREIVCNTCQGYVVRARSILQLLKACRPSSGARGNAKPKECVNCEGKGWAFMQTQV